MVSAATVEDVTVVAGVAAVLAEDAGVTAIRRSGVSKLIDIGGKHAVSAQACRKGRSGRSWASRGDFSEAPVFGMEMQKQGFASRVDVQEMDYPDTSAPASCC